jgi:hypothetical protein
VGWRQKAQWKISVLTLKSEGGREKWRLSGNEASGFKESAWDGGTGSNQLIILLVTFLSLWPNTWHNNLEGVVVCQLCPAPLFLRQSIMGKATHLIMDRKHRKRIYQGAKASKHLKTHLKWSIPPGRPNLYLPPLSYNAIILWLHQGINPLIRLEPSGSSHFPISHQVSTTPSVHELGGYISYSNHDSYGAEQRAEAIQKWKAHPARSWEAWNASQVILPTGKYQWKFSTK